MVAISDILNIVFGVTATLLACGAIWATRRYNNATKDRNDLCLRQVTGTQNSDLELGLLNHNESARPMRDSDEDEVQNILPMADKHTQNQRNNLHAVIGDALEVFSKHLRAHN